MNNDGPLAFFITWSVYGARLQGDENGWRRRGQGEKSPQPQLARWRSARLNHEVLLLTAVQRTIVERECQRHREHRRWRLWAVAGRSNHVHVVVTAFGISGRTVRDQLKANCTRGLREEDESLRNRPVWSVGGDWKCINSETDLETVCAYVLDAQDRMEFR